MPAGDGLHSWRETAPRVMAAVSRFVSGHLRILSHTVDIGWTYVILAEMVNARKGVGYMVEAARKVLDFERVYAGIIAIGVPHFCSGGCLPAWKIACSRGRSTRPQPSLPWQSPMDQKTKITLRHVSRVFAGPTGEKVEACATVN